MSKTKESVGFPDFHHKMSKKIAQLTKVIYALNTKNDDHEYQLKSLADTYESEIEEILQDTSKKINHFKEMLESKSNEAKVCISVYSNCRLLKR
jgi:K+/H+ antiporter YhaU regulatory subunit KhtT